MESLEQFRGIVTAAKIAPEAAQRAMANLLTRMAEIDPKETAPDGDTYNLLWDAVLDEIKAAVFPGVEPAPTAGAPKPKVWAVRVGYLETCFVERDAIVVATTAEEAQHRALLSQQIDSGEDHCQEVRECQVLGLVEDREPEELREPTPDDLVMAERVRDDDEMRARFEDADDGCPKGDPECLGNNGDCHDACVAPETEQPRPYSVFYTRDDGGYFRHDPSRGGYPTYLHAFKAACAEALLDYGTKYAEVYGGGSTHRITREEGERFRAMAAREGWAAACIAEARNPTSQHDGAPGGDGSEPIITDGCGSHCL
jgi:hypothetical protein